MCAHDLLWWGHDPSFLLCDNGLVETPSHHLIDCRETWFVWHMLWQVKQWHKDLQLILGESVDIIQPISSIDCFIKFIFDKQPKFDLFHNISIYFIILDESVDIIKKTLILLIALSILFLRNTPNWHTSWHIISPLPIVRESWCLHKFDNHYSRSKLLATFGFYLLPFKWAWLHG